MSTNVIYLHGFASAPRSAKSQIFARRLAQKGINMREPDLNLPDFEHLTLTAMIRRTAGEIAVCPPGPVYLIGTSLGGTVALHLVDRFGKTEAARVEKIMLLAPSLDFVENRRRQFGNDGMERWRSTGQQMIYNYKYKENRPLSYGLIEDIAQYDSFGVHVSLPILIYHGIRDESVDYHQSARFARERPNVTLRLLESDHQMLDQIETLWEGAVRFLGI